MSETIAEITRIVECLDERNLELLLGIARLFAPDNIATADDIENHRIVAEEYKHGEYSRMNREDWGFDE
jgi:hypothetical protein